MATSPPVIKLPAQSQTSRDRIVATPFQFYLNGSENLRVSGWNSLANATIVVRVRFVNDLGELNWQDYKLTPTTDRLLTTLDFPLGAGVVSNVVAFVQGAAPVIGQTFVQVAIVVGSGPAALLFGVLVQGYVTSQQALSFPGSPVQSSLDGGGYLRYVSGTTPPLGGEVSETVPTGARWELVSFIALFATSATVINRRPALRFLSSASTFLRLPTVADVAALGSIVLQWAQGIPLAASLDGVVYTTAIPSSMPLKAGDSFGTTTTNLQPGDDYVIPRYIVREWLEAT